jgi:hypothetical protein
MTPSSLVGGYKRFERTYAQVHDVITQKITTHLFTAVKPQTFTEEELFYFHLLH